MKRTDFAIIAAAIKRQGTSLQSSLNLFRERPTESTLWSLDADKTIA